MKRMSSGAMQSDNATEPYADRRAEHGRVRELGGDELVVADHADPARAAAGEDHLEFGLIVISYIKVPDTFVDLV